MNQLIAEGRRPRQPADSTRTTAAVLVGVRTIEMQSLELPAPGPGQLLAEVLVAGLCGSDMAVYQGHHAYKRPPVVLGHEFCGVVRAVGAGVSTSLLGQQVCAASFAQCGCCQACLRGDIQRCAGKRNLSHLDWHGSFAGHVLLDWVMTHILPPSLDPDLGALVEPLTISLHVLKRCTPLTDRVLVIVGAGSIGLGCIALARRAGTRRIVCVDQGLVKRELALRLGADHMVDTTEPDAVGELVRVLGPNRADAVIVAASFDGAYDLALRASCPGGVIDVVTYATPGVAPNLNALLRAEVTLRFSYLSTAAEFDEIIGALVKGEIDPMPMVTHRLDLESAGDAFALKEQQPAEVAKVLLHNRRANRLATSGEVA
jgi:threonine dehydrogenase-like Zn-dependent dehydrogenase